MKAQNYSAILVLFDPLYIFPLDESLRNGHHSDVKTDHVVWSCVNI